MTNHWGNLMGRFSPEGIKTTPLPPGRSFDPARYPVATSDALAHLVLEHQAGWVNRAVEAIYRARAIAHAGLAKPSPEQDRELEDQARILTRYLLFAEEPPLPGGGIAGDPAFKEDFLSGRKVDSKGRSLKDLELRTRLFRHRCSYLIHGSLFRALPEAVKGRVLSQLRAALDTRRPHPEYAYLPPAEKQAIHAILKETLPQLPRGW